jgi:EAL domain-containing protein (putative c-di-GMP-specific phosphodiesterase class I)
MNAPNVDHNLRLVGLAFAGADLVFEVDGEGRITFVLGAAEGMTGRSDRALVGQSWTSLVGEDEADMLASLPATLGLGERFGPAAVALPKGRSAAGLVRYANLSAFRLPQRPSFLCCALSLGSRAAGSRTPRTADGFLAGDDPAAAISQTLTDAEEAGAIVRLDLVELEGLQKLISGMSSEEGRQTRRRLAATFRADSYGGVGAAEVGPDRFALVRSAGASAEDLATRVKVAAGADLAAKIAELPTDKQSAVQSAKAVRYALDRFIAAGPEAASKGFLGTVNRMVGESAKLKQMVTDDSVVLEYQPVVDLIGRRAHHFEALARFGNDGAGEMIRLAEEMDLIADFDATVLRAAVKALETASSDTRIAVNVSASSLLKPQFLSRLDEVCGKTHGLRGRLMFEVTESQVIEDLAKAELIITELRRLGHQVCLDDFGAGAASFDYLRRLSFDFIKIDGRFIQSLETGNREAKLVKHLAAIGADLGSRTIAEMIETEARAEMVLRLGVNLGQGWAFAKPGPEPVWSPASPAAPALKRVGASESWG